MDDNIKIIGGIKMGTFMDAIIKMEQQEKIKKAIETLKNNGVYGKAYIDDIKTEAALMAKGGGVGFNMDKDGSDMADPRYNVPKEQPKASEELVEETVVNTEIYRRAKLAVLQAEISPNSKNAILEAQRKQVAYGIDKYPEPLNANTWSISETVDHIMDESIDKLHYLIMLSIKLENELASYPNSAIFNINSLSSRIHRINHMINNAIDDLDYLVALDTMMMEEMNREAGACNLTRGIPNDVMASMAYAIDISQELHPNIGLNNHTISSGADFDGDTLRVFTSEELDEMAAKRDE